MFNIEARSGYEMIAKLHGQLKRQADIYKPLEVHPDDIMGLIDPYLQGLPMGVGAPVVVLGTNGNFERQTTLLERQIKLAGINVNVDPSLRQDTAGGLTFDTHHLIWVQDGTKPKNSDAAAPTDARPLTLSDGLALTLVTPNLKALLKQPIVLRGTSLGPDSEPYLHYSILGPPWLGHRNPRIIDPNYRVFTCTG